MKVARQVALLLGMTVLLLASWLVAADAKLTHCADFD